MTGETPRGLRSLRPVTDRPDPARPQSASQSEAPEMPRLGRLEVRLACDPSEVAASQALRYRIFYDEMHARPSPEMAAAQRDFDVYDGVCDHLLVIDHSAPRDQQVVGTYRLLRQEVAAANGGFYTQAEFDMAPLLKRAGDAARFLELGRSCVHPDYRNRPTLELLWVGIMSYVSHYKLDVMIGCASLPGTDPSALTLPLAFLHHYCLAPEPWRVRAQADRYVAMDQMRKEDIDVREALRALPPLVKGYVRAGSFIGDGAVVDEQFNTVDVMIIFPVAEINDRYYTRFSRTKR